MATRSLFAVFLSTLILAHAAAATQSVHVVYVAQGTDLITYDVNANTGQMKQVGKPINLGSGAGTFPIASTPDGRFLYVPCCQSGNQSLSVYSTDARGVPQAQPIQTIQGNFWQIEVDPTGRFAYGLTINVDQDGNQIYAVQLYDIDANSGKLTARAVQSRHNEGTCCEWWNLDGFSSTGSKLYEDEGNDLGGGGGSLYYEQQINPETGKLAKRVFLINGTYGGEGQYAYVAIGDKTLLMSQTIDGDSSESWLDVFPHISDPKTPIIHCTTTMLDSCGYVESFQLDPSQNYVFIAASQLPTTVAQIDLSGKQLVATGSTLPALLPFVFSPDGTEVYTLNFVNGVSSTIQTYLFDASTGTLTEGGSVVVGGSNFEPGIYTAIRK